MKKRILSIIRLVVSIGLLFLLFWLFRNNLGEVLTAIRRANPFWFILTFLLHMVIMLFLSWRMMVVFEIAGVVLSFKKAVQLNFIGYFFNNFLPTTVGGDVIKAYYSGRMSNKNIESYSATLADRIFGTYAIFLIAGASVGFVLNRMDNRLIAWLIWTILIISTTGLLFIPTILNFVRRLALRTKISRLHGITDQLQFIASNYGRRKSQSLMALLLSIVTKLLSVCGVYFLTLSLGINIPFLTLLWVVPIAFAVSMFPSLNGLGIREGTMVYFLGPFVGNQNALALSLLWLTVYLLSDTIGGLIYAFSKDFRAEANNRQTQIENK